MFCSHWHATPCAQGLGRLLDRLHLSSWGGTSRGNKGDAGMMGRCGGDTRAGLHFWVSRSELWRENTFDTDSLTAMQTAYVQFPVREKEQSFSYKFAATRVGLFQTFNRFFHTLAPKFRCFFWTSSNFYGTPPTLAAVRYQEPEQAPRRTPRQHGNTIIQTLKIVTKMTSVMDSGPCRSEFWITTTEWVTWNFNCSMIVVCWGLPKPCNSGKKHHP